MHWAAPQEVPPYPAEFKTPHSGVWDHGPQNEHPGSPTSRLHFSTPHSPRGQHREMSNTGTYVKDQTGQSM